MNRSARRRLISKFAAFVCFALTLLACWPLFSVLFEVGSRGYGVLSWNFLSQDPDFQIVPGSGFVYTGGIWPAIAGTGLVVGLATLLGAPIGLASGMFLSEYGRNKFGDVVRTFVDAMAGIPSIVAGLFGYAFWVTKHGFSAWAGAIALAVLMIPTITRTTEEALRTVPQSLRDASLALGGPRWYTTLRIVVPAAAAPIITGLLLGLARIAGETAPLLLTVATSSFFNADPSQPVATLPYVVYNYITDANDSKVAQGWGAALVLISGVLLLNIVVRLLTRTRRRRAA